MANSTIFRRLYMLLLVAAFVIPIVGLDSGSTAAGYQEKTEVTHKVIAAPGDLDTDDQGVELWHDYGSFALYRVSDSAWQNLAADIRAAATLANEMDRILIDGFEEAVAAEAANRPGGAALQIVQFVGPIKEEWLAAVEAVGATPVQYIATNGYLLWADEAARVELARMEQKGDFLQFSALYPTSLKAGPALKTRDNAGEVIPVVVQMVRHDGQARSESVIQNLAVKQLADWEPILAFQNIIVEIHAGDTAAIAGLPDVFWIEERLENELMDEVQGQILAGNLNAGQDGPSGPGYLAWLDGHGFSTDPADYPIVDVTDDGIGNGTVNSGDPTLHEFGNTNNPTRLAYVANCAPSTDGRSSDGHGHINASIAGGYDTRAGFPFQDPLGYQRGLGINPYGRFAGTKVFLSGYFVPSECGDGTDQDVLKSIQDHGALINSNSWGCSGCAGTYDDSSQAYDAGVRDADLGQAGNQALIVLFSAGNSGEYGAGTVGTPGNGKNMITVGASENQRPSDEDGDWTDGCGDGPTDADDAMDVTDFSSRGPAPGSRAKPELIAPGTHIQGTASTEPSYNGTGVCDKYRPSGQTIFAASSGTSHSVPAVAGAASLAYYWMENSYGLASPSPAVMKAYLIAHPTYLTGAGANDTLPSNNQGYGMPNMSAMFDDTPKFLMDQAVTFDNVGETWVWEGSVADPAKPVRIVLAYTDAPGALGTSPQVNDLNLAAEVGADSYLGNVFTGQWSNSGGLADPYNNYEAVFLPAGASGDIEITVTGFNIAGDGVPNSGDSTDQDFALVCYNCDDTPTSGTISGIVRAEIDEARLEGIRVEVYRWMFGPWVLVSQSYTNANGGYNISGLTSGTYHVRFSDDDGNYISEYYDDSPDLDGATDINVLESWPTLGINAWLEDAGRIAGSVTAETGGAPLQDIEVCAFSHNGIYWETFSCERTNYSGDYVIPYLPVGVYRIMFKDEGGSYVNEFYDNASNITGASNVTVSAGSTAMGIDAALADAGHITGSVSDEDSGGPLADIRVCASTFNGYYWGIRSCDYTDGSGAYSIGGLGNDTYHVGFRDNSGSYLSEYYDDALDHYNAADISVSGGSTTAGIDAGLAKAGYLTGTVTPEGGGAPLDDIDVCALFFNGSFWQQRDVFCDRTSANGVYEIHLPVGAYRIEFDDDGGAYVREYYDDAPDVESADDVSISFGGTTGGIDAALADAGHITGRVTAEPGGTPLDGLDVVGYIYDGSSWVGKYLAFTDENGDYDMGGLPGGVYRVQFYEYSAAHLFEYYDNVPDLESATDIVVPAGGTVTGIDAALAEPGHISGTVTMQAGGVPLEDIEVCAYSFNGLYWAKILCDLTDGEGFYFLGHMWSGSYRVKFTDDSGHYPVEYYDNAPDIFSADDVYVNASYTTSGIDAVLAEPGHIAGTVTAEDSGAPLEGIKVCAYYDNGIDWRQYDCAYSDAAGDYDLGGLFSYTYRVNFNHRDGIYLEEYYDNAPDIGSADDVFVAAGGTAAGIDAALAPTTAPPPNDDFDAAAPVAAVPYQDTLDVRGATTAVDDPDLPCGPGGKGFGSVWYALTPDEPSLLTADTFGSSYDTVLAVWTGSRGSLVSVACNDDYGGSQSQVADVTLAAGTSYYIEVAAAIDDLDELVLHIDLAPTSPFANCVSDTGSSATVTIPDNVTVYIMAGFSLEAGDEFALFTADGLICAGHGVWQATTGGNLDLAAWGDDVGTAVTDGFTAGEVMGLALWDASADDVYYPLAVTYSQGDGLYAAASSHIVESIDVTQDVTQDVALQAGWNLISTYVQVEDATLTAMLGGIMDDVVLVKNGAGQVYWPAYGIDQIGDWDVRESYQVYMSDSALLSNTGTAVDPAQTSITLPDGWNMPAYLRNSAMPIDQALAGISSELYLAKNGAGQVYWPDFGINEIGAMQPGDGYQVYMSGAGTLTYPGN